VRRMPKRSGRRAGGVTETARKIAASVATVAATGGLIAFAHLGAFDDSNDPFPHAEIAGTR
jgi:hypothetical protein